MSRDSYDVIIVGGGHNGLVAACYLALAKKKVLILEANPEVGGATSSLRVFPDFDARISVYAYLVSLLPDQIVADLSLNFTTLSRKVSSYTPTNRGGRSSGLLVNRVLDKESEESFASFTGSGSEFASWRSFYGQIEKFAQVIAPTLLQPLRTRAEIEKLAISKVDKSLWDYLIEKPLAEVIHDNFNDDIVKGIVLTDGLIGTMTSATALLANKCFLYHLIGNGSGEWKVPKGGMGALVLELLNRAGTLGVEIITEAEVSNIFSDARGCEVEVGAKKYRADYVLANCAPRVLARLTRNPQPDLLDGSQLKVNMLLKKLPRLKSGIAPEIAFAGTFHIDESYAELELAYSQGTAGKIPAIIPAEMYCHTLTDTSILSPELALAGYHTLTLFALHTPASLFEQDNEGVKKEMVARLLAGVNKYLVDPIEECFAVAAQGDLCLDVKSPLDLEGSIGLPRGNIFHSDLQFPFADEAGETQESPASRWGVATTDERVLLCGAGALRGGGVSGIGGHNAAMALFELYGINFIN